MSNNNNDHINAVILKIMFYVQFSKPGVPFEGFLSQLRQSVSSEVPKWLRRDEVLNGYRAFCFQKNGSQTEECHSKEIFLQISFLGKDRKKVRSIC